MSAFICNDYHTSLIAAYADNNSLSAVRGLAVEQSGRILHTENVKSVNYRYNETPAAPDFFRFDERAVLAVFDLNPVEIIKAATCLEYQSCEHPAWQVSLSKRIVEAVISHALYSLDGYREAAWEIDAPVKQAA